jgi:AraC family transcriptional regulator, transcriptional activator of pobA
MKEKALAGTNTWKKFDLKNQEGAVSLLSEEASKHFRQKKKNPDLNRKLAGKAEHNLVHLDEILPGIGLTVPSNKHADFIIVYCTKCKGRKKIGDFTFSLRNQTLIVIPAYSTRSLFFDRGCKGYVLTFNLRFFLEEYFPRHRLLKMAMLKPELIPYTYLGSEEGKQMGGIFQTLLDEKLHSRKNREEIISLKILELILHCERLLKFENCGQKKPFPPLVIKYIDLVRQHLKAQHSVRFYAEKLLVHPNQLNANTKKYLRQSAKATLDIMIIQEAEYFLLQTAFSVKEIAFELGFQSASHFFRFFKRHKGVSPASYRSQMFENVAN